VQHWPGYTPAQKRSVWRRITMEGTAWRFNRYAERAREATGVDHPRPTATATANAAADPAANTAASAAGSTHPAAASPAV